MPDTPTTDHLKVAVLEERLSALREAIKLQALEYERRLTDLNHAHAQAATDKNKFLTTEMFYANKEAVQKWQNEYDQRWSRLIGIAIGSGLAGGSLASVIARLF